VKRTYDPEGLFFVHHGVGRRLRRAKSLKYPLLLRAS
jgi:hypothetical protein